MMDFGWSAFESWNSDSFKKKKNHEIRTNSIRSFKRRCEIVSSKRDLRSLFHIFLFKRELPEERSAIVSSSSNIPFAMRNSLPPRFDEVISTAYSRQLHSQKLQVLRLPATILPFFLFFFLYLTIEQWYRGGTSQLICYNFCII